MGRLTFSYKTELVGMSSRVKLEIKYRDLPPQTVFVYLDVTGIEVYIARHNNHKKVIIIVGKEIFTEQLVWTNLVITKILGEYIILPKQHIFTTNELSERLNLILYRFKELESRIESILSIFQTRILVDQSRRTYYA